MLEQCISPQFDMDTNYITVSLQISLLGLTGYQLRLC